MKIFTDTDLEFFKLGNINLENINKLENTIKWYRKKNDILNLSINSKDIKQINNLKELLEEKDCIFGVEYSKVLREIIIDKIKLLQENNNNLGTSFVYSTISNVPNRYCYSGTMYYYILYFEKKLKVYYLDNYYRIIKKTDIEIESIIEKIKQKTNFKNKDLYFETIQYKDNLIDRTLYLYGVDENSFINELDKFLTKKNIKNSSNSDRLNQKKFIEKKFIIIALVLFLVIVLKINGLL